MKAIFHPYRHPTLHEMSNKNELTSHCRFGKMSKVRVISRNAGIHKKILSSAKP